MTRNLQQHARDAQWLCDCELRVWRNTSGSPPDAVAQQLGHQIDRLDQRVEERVEAAAVRNDKVALQQPDTMEFRD